MMRERERERKLEREREREREREHPHLGATYKVIRTNDRSYGIEVSIPNAFPAKITGLATEEDAESWVERHKNEIAKGVPQRLTFQRASEILGISSTAGTKLRVVCFTHHASIVSQHLQRSHRCVGGRGRRGHSDASGRVHGRYGLRGPRSARCSHCRPPFADRGGACSCSLYRCANARPNGWPNVSAPHSPQLALDRSGCNIGVCHLAVRTIARKYPVFPKAV